MASTRPIPNRSASSRLRFFAVAALASLTGVAVASGRPAASGPPTVVSRGTGILHSTYTWDFDSGNERAAGADVWWDRVDTDVWRLMPSTAGPGLVNIGLVDFDSITLPRLAGLRYTTCTPSKVPPPGCGIEGSPGPDNKLVAGDVFAVQTDVGNFAKVKILTYGRSLHIRWVTYAKQPKVELGAISLTFPKIFPPRAGSEFSVRVVEVRLKGTTKAVQPSSVSCTSRIGPTALRGYGRGKCTWRLPVSARGKTLSVGVTVTYQGASRSGHSAFPIV
jgi:hypothetical protein